MTRNKNLKKILPIPFIAVLLICDFVSWQEIRISLAWVVGTNAGWAAAAILALANMAMAAFFIEGITKRASYVLHAIALLQYVVVAISIYASGVNHGVEHFPAAVAETAFGMSRESALKWFAGLLAMTIALTSCGFWATIGNAIDQTTKKQNQIVWEDAARASGKPLTSILNQSGQRAAGD